jgi:xanthine dehydrogenase small subunit
MKTQPLQFLRHGQVVTLDAVDTNRTLLEVLREDLHCTGTKEGCNEGDCGACTVVVGEAVNGKLQTRAVNSCIKLAHSVNGKAVWTVEDIAPTLGTDVSSLPPEGAVPGLGRPGAAAAAIPLHPAQAAMVACHGSQCGFCTPGFVMSLFGLYQSCQGQAVSREQAQAALSGNLCRCTGYRPILDAAQQMHTLPAALVDESEVLSKLELLRQKIPGPQPDLAYKLPKTLPKMLQERSRNPQAQIVAGCTDVGLWVTKQHRQFDQVLDITGVAELRRVEDYPHHIAIGAAVNLTDAFATLVADRPQLAEFAHRFAGLPVRNSGTLGGNVANGSPIGDSMPLLIAMGANVVLMAWRKVNGKNRVVHREMRLEDLYTGYRTNVMAADEVLAWIKVAKPVGEASGISALRVYKISKRFEDDISAVCLALDVAVVNGVVQRASIGAGGVAATPVRARKTEATLVGQPWNQATVRQAMAVLRQEFSPISDMRASAAYRSTVLGNLLQRYWLERQGGADTDLQQLSALEVAA